MLLPLAWVGSHSILHGLHQCNMIHCSVCRIGAWWWQGRGCGVEPGTTSHSLPDMMNRHVIGDALDDAIAAAAVGVPAVLYDGGSHPSDALRSAGVPVVSTLIEAIEVAGCAAPVARSAIR